MLVVLLSWFIISLVLLTAGSFFLQLYNRICGRDESYSLIETLLLGTSFFLILLSIISFFLPINTAVLAIFVVLSLCYWLMNVRAFKAIKEQVQSTAKAFSIYELCFSSIFILFILFVVAWGVSNYDSACYHYQTVRWIEEFPIVPGLGNIEERLGFNSNYFLLSAPFTFRFLLGEPLFALQGLLVVCFFIWIVAGLVSSKYNIKYFVLLVLFFVLVYFNLTSLGDSSTDIYPNLILFFLVASIAMNPRQLEDKFLFWMLIPVSLATFKLSIATFAFISLVVLWTMIKQKEYRALWFTVFCASILCLLWMIRNVFLSGYLVYPLHELDLFSFDWKVPKEIALKERAYIHSGAIWQFKNVYVNARTILSSPALSYAYYYLIAGIYILSVFSVLVFSYAFFLKRVKIHRYIFGIYLVLIFSLLANFVSAPDFRFASGIFFSLIFLQVVVLSEIFSWRGLGHKIYAVLSGLMLVYLLWVCIPWIKMTFTKTSDVFVTVLTPRNYLQKANYEEDRIGYREHTINNNVTIYVTTNLTGLVYDKLPCVSENSDIVSSWRFQDYNDLEARSHLLKDGFRTKRHCVENNVVDPIVDAPPLIHIDTLKSYSLLKDETLAKRNEFRKAYNSVENNKQKQDSILSKAQRYLFTTSNKFFRSWYGTAWTFEGHSQEPREGSIACGYYNNGEGIMFDSLKGYNSLYHSKYKVIGKILDKHMVLNWIKNTPYAI